jgi:Leucine-rich repeat (LRR) protein
MELDLRDNQLTSLPAEIGNLTGLEELNLYGLQRLRVDNNPITTPPMEECEKGITDIRA